MEGSNAATEAPKNAEENGVKTHEPVTGESAVAADAGADPVDGSVPNDDDDEPKEEKPSDQDSKKEKVDSPSEGGASRRGKRVRKSIEKLTVEDKPRKEMEIPNGKGEKLEQMPNVVANFQAITWSDPHLQDLYTIVFGRGKKKQFKEHLLQFNGVVHPDGKEEESKDKILAKMYKLKMNDLKAVMDLADIDRRSADGEKGTPGKILGKEELCQKFLDWLEEPKASGKSGKNTGKKKKGKRKSGSSKKVTPAKKARKTTPSKTSAKKEKSPAKVANPNTKAAAKSKAESPKAETTTQVVLNIPGADTEKVRAKVKSIVESANKSELTVKGVRKMLEEWLDTDLTDHKDAIRSIVMEVM